MKRANVWVLALALLAVGAWAGNAVAAEKADKATKTAKKTISGKSDCATCSGITEDGHQIMLVDKKGMRWVLLGDSESYKKAHKVRMDDKKMTATLAGDPVTKKDRFGKEYKEVKVTDVTVES
jgi:hypothetical protein